MTLISPCIETEYRSLGPMLGPEAENRRLDDFLGKCFPFRSRTEWKALCNDGQVLVNAQKARATRRLKCGDTLSVYHPQSAEPEVNDELRFIFEDRGILAIEKPANLPMHESGFYRRNTLVALLHRDFGKDWSPVHRLDRETSGVVICASTSELRRSLSDAFLARDIAKTYIAILSGTPTWEQISVDRPLSMSTSFAIPHKQVDDSGEEARTDFVIIERAQVGTLVEVRPLSGRGNQIRAHAAWLGHHIIGDKVYHQDRAVCQAYREHGDTQQVKQSAGHSRHALHAAKIEFAHPKGGKFTAESPLPADLIHLWQSLGIKS
jgi:23S rRNA pseudouridine1911/1915/1917 synthase